MNRQTLPDPNDPLNAVSLRDHAHIGSNYTRGYITITRPERNRQTVYKNMSPVTSLMIARLMTNRHWVSRVNEPAGRGVFSWNLTARTVRPKSELDS